MLSATGDLQECPSIFEKKKKRKKLELQRAVYPTFHNVWKIFCNPTFVGDLRRSKEVISQFPEYTKFRNTVICKDKGNCHRKVQLQGQTAELQLPFCESRRCKGAAGGGRDQDLAGHHRLYHQPNGFPRKDEHDHSTLGF